MRQLMFTYFMALLSVFIVSAASVKELHSAELNGEIRAIVENILNEKNVNDGRVSHDTYLERRVEYLEKKVSSMEVKLAEQKQTVADLENAIQRCDNGGNVEKEDNNINEKSTDENSDTVERNNATESLAVSVNRLIAGGRRIKRAVGNVAFSAYLTATNSHTNVGDAIKFDQVLINDGQGYNKYTGAFTAPLSGTYLFAFHFDTRKLTFIRLVVNGVNQVDAVANAHTNVESRHSQSMGGNTAIVHVGHGEAVLVETYEIRDGETASSNTFRLCTFSGVLLY